MKPQTTEQLVRKCFCKGCAVFGMDSCNLKDVNEVARAARLFVREENKGKMRMLDMRDVEFSKVNRNKKGSE